ncbi:MAG TPA: TetR/AcrR family transcriptional regulator [Solirubrobacteraceae bacterium]|nr:TetR/AcrR family transcriptional regulator [Solirubrobacteraceae bacterium]
MPHGPHRLARDEVILHQRARIHGAMIEAVAECGYEDTSVKQVISLAGVSRRSFYEQFANKQESFLATFDLLAHQTAQRARYAYLHAEGGLEERLRAAFGELADIAREDHKPTRLVLLEAQTAGAAGTLRLCKGIATCEQMLSRSFVDIPQTSPLPTPIVRGVAGGLHSATSRLVRDGQITDSASLAEEMLRWTMLFQDSAATRLAERMTPQLSRRMRDISLSTVNAAEEIETFSPNARERLMQTALRLAAAYEYRELTAPQIADEASVPIETFLEHFAGKEECYLAAFDMIGEELLALVADPELTSSDWPHAVRHTVARLMRHLAEHPLHARTIGQVAFFAGRDAMEHDLELARRIATMLTEGAPVSVHSDFMLDAIAGAIWHTIRCQVANERIQLLDALSDYVSYIVLTPFVGAQAAVEIVTDTVLA